MRSINGISRLGVLAALASLSFASSACASSGGLSGDSLDSARLMVRGGTVAFIERAPAEQRADKAERILEVTAKILAAASSEPVTVHRLAELAAQNLPEDLTPGQLVLALELIDMGSKAVAERIGVGGLEADTVLRVREVLGWVDSVARLYAASG